MTATIANIIDHTLLKGSATEKDIIKLAAEAKAYQFASVCVNPTWVSAAYEVLKETNVKVCTVIGFPLGASTSKVKRFETEDAIENGATEIDMVINIGALKNKDNELVKKDIEAVVRAAGERALVKVIFETCLLTEEEKIRACQLAVQAGADYVKTSTGFSTGGATVEDIKLMREIVGPSIGVKASGGIRNIEDVQMMVKAGATRIGASSGVSIVKGETSSTSY
ncbi:deoxyribose-phosphate aldolase [Halalkalibacter lacteus]|uniref:deoxyribose-phosphate aldolase n=1 Tax=Halalkalibacter lacteus TaxID=3090663 RepID=UPI002FC5F6DF